MARNAALIIILQLRKLGDVEGIVGELYLGGGASGNETSENVGDTSSRVRLFIY